MPFGEFRNSRGKWVSLPERSRYLYLSKMCDFFRYEYKFCICFSCCLLKYQEVLGGIMPVSSLKEIFSLSKFQGDKVLCEICSTRAFQACKIVWLVGCRLKANCPSMEPGLTGDVPSVGVFPRDSSPYLRKFRRKPRKTPNG